MNPTLEKWRKVCEAATEGPWISFAGVLRTDKELIGVNASGVHKHGIENSEFIALSRTALPVAIECLEMALEGLKYYQFGHDHPDTLEPHCKSCGVIKQIHARLEQVK